MEKLEKRYGKQLPFEVPAGYFDELTENIMYSVRSSCPEDFNMVQPAKSGKFQLYLQRCLPYVSMAAIVTFVVIMMQVFVVKSYDKDIAEVAVFEFESNGETEITDEEIIEYLSNSVYDVESFLASMQ